MRIGFIGLGLMGRGMAANLQKVAETFVVHDLSQDAARPFLDAGADWADSPRALAATCDVVFTSLPKPADVEAVGFGENGLVEGFAKGASWFDLSTNSVDVVRDIHARLAQRGVMFFDAPVSGGPAGAASGKLAIWVGGDRATFDRLEPVLAAMADQARYIGEIGAGSVAKLTHNLASAGMTQLLAECMTMGVKAGLEPLQLYEAIRGGAYGRMRSFDLIARRWLPGKLDPPNFELQLMHKDVKLGVQLARDVDVPMRLCNLVLEELTEAMNRGWERRDAQTYLLLQQERAGVAPFEAPIEDIEDVMKRT
ncbi:NAD(P)-dependent oxidoreductase [Antarctobacter sp.]|uniref:NAD(P)-dependent oxidoreductase n=1 Tax=Antarctobacter sp. TaxID=1872577 RepID=UPI003A938286